MSTIGNNTTNTGTTNTGTTGTTNTGTTGTTNTGTTANSSGVDATSLMGTTDQFLNILLAQLKYQDPLEPMKGTEFIDSISRLSNVEQQINSNKYLSSINDLLKSANSKDGNPVSYIDKNVTFSSTQFALTDSLGGFSYNLPTDGTPTSVTITIKDSSGNVVAASQGTTKAGQNNVKWDGTDSTGNQLKDGLYTVDVEYPDPNTVGSSINVPTYTSGVVTQADFTGDTPTLTADGIQFSLDAIMAISSNQVASSD